MKPHVGDIVWYVPRSAAVPSSEHRAVVPWPATVTEVYTETDVTLRVYPPDGTVVETPRVSRGDSPGHWRAQSLH
ncbi:MAG: hypothetical protein AAGC55_23465 [Myxococcota bacterium]